MSMQKKLLQAASAAAEEATTNERGRCLWILDKLETDLQAKLDKKILVEQERHLIETKLKLAKGLIAQVRRGIVSGIRPDPPSAEAEPKEAP